MSFEPVETIPILRSFDEAALRRFYVDWLGFTVDFEHRFGPGMPLYLQVSRAGVVLHLSEHEGDGVPGVRVRIHLADVAAYRAELAARPLGYALPELDTPDWGFIELTVVDPAHNRLTFAQRLAPQAT